MCSTYNGALNKFASELHKCHDQFQKNALGALKKVDQNYFGIKIGSNKPDSQSKSIEKNNKEQFVPLQDIVECMQAGL